jgi:hypothetical protein
MCVIASQMHKLTELQSSVVSLTTPSSSRIGRSFGSNPSASASSALLAAALKSLAVFVMSTSTLRSRSWSDCAANNRSATATHSSRQEAALRESCVCVCVCVCVRVCATSVEAAVTWARPSAHCSPSPGGLALQTGVQELCKHSTSAITQ